MVAKNKSRLDAMKSSVQEVRADVEQAAGEGSGISQRFSNAKAIAEKAPSSATPDDKNLDESQVEGGKKRVTIKLDDIVENKYNARRFYKSEITKARASSMAADGQLTAVEVTRLKDGKYMLVDGHYRLRAARHLNWDSLVADIVEDLDDQKLYKRSFAHNAQRSAQTPLDNAVVWNELMQQGVFKSIADIEEVTGFSVSWISKTLNLAKLPTFIIDQMNELEEPIPLSSAYEIALAFNESGDEAIVQSVLNYYLEKQPGKRDLEAFRKALVEKREPVQRGRARKHVIQTADGKGTIKEFDSGRVSIDLVITDPLKREALIAEFREKYKASE